MFFSIENPNWVLKNPKNEVHKNPKFRLLQIKKRPRPLELHLDVYIEFEVAY